MSAGVAACMITLEFAEVAGSGGTNDPFDFCTARDFTDEPLTDSIQLQSLVELKGFIRRSSTKK